MSERRISLRGLTCANCAGKIETAVGKMKEVNEAEINLIKQEMTISLVENVSGEDVIHQIQRAVHKYEADVKVSLLPKGGKGQSRAVSNKPVQAHAHPAHGADCGCGHDHGHGEAHAHPAHGADCGCGHDHGHGEAHAHTHGDDCGCGVEHSHEAVAEDVQAHTSGVEFNWKQKILRFGVGLAIFLGAIFTEGNLSLGMFFVAYAIFGYDVLWKALRNIAKGQVFDENFLMSVSTIGAIGIGDMAEAVFVMLFYQVGEAFQDYAVARSRKSITALLDIRPDYAQLVTETGLRRVAPEEVTVGDYILVKAGERIPLDGVIIEGQALLDTAALTGEAIPQHGEVGSEVMSGCINLDGTLKIRVSRLFGDSTVMKILEMVENAAGKKSKTERFITRFARVYTPAVVGFAVTLACIPPLLGFGAFQMWFGRALIFLVVSCPCALVISVPLTYFAGIGAASRNGILLKGGNDLDTLGQIRRVVFDKTGTLTKGKFLVTELLAETSEEELLRMAAIGEKMSNHPIADAILKKYAETAQGALPEAMQYRELGGFGISYQYEGEAVLLGNRRLMETEGISFAEYTGAGTVIYVARGGAYLGYLVVADTIKDGCKEALEKLRHMGVDHMVMLTGDRKQNAESVAGELGIDEVYAELLPADKVAAMERITEMDTDRKTAFIGDGINDAPVLAGADLGVAMGSMGSDAAIEAADMLLMDDDIGKMAIGMRIARSTTRLVRQNIVFALGIKFIVLILSALGMATMWMAVFADVGVAVLAILNAMRKK